MSQVAGYVMRIKDERWVNQVFDTAIYFSNMNRKWLNGQTILFVHRTKTGDAFVGYGIVSREIQKRYLPEEEKILCEQGGWKRAIEFTYVMRFEKPLLIKETVFGASKLRGRYFHGLKLSSEQVDRIIEQAESLRNHQKS
jgi:hypothetical protein